MSQNLANDNRNDEIKLKINAALDEELEQIDYVTKMKLSSSRQKAAAAYNKAHQKGVGIGVKSFFSKWQGTAAAGVFSLALLAVFIPATNDTLQSSDDMLMLAMFNPVLEEEPEMLEQLEFIAWLEQETLLEELPSQYAEPSLERKGQI